MTLKLKQFNKSNNEVNSSIRREYYVIYSEIIEAVSIHYTYVTVHGKTYLNAYPLDKQKR